MSLLALKYTNTDLGFVQLDEFLERKKQKQKQKTQPRHDCLYFWILVENVKAPANLSGKLQSKAEAVFHCHFY